MPSSMYVIFAVYSLVFLVFMFFLNKNAHKHHDRFHEK
jgi:uncharacterized membrane protein